MLHVVCESRLFSGKSTERNNQSCDITPKVTEDLALADV